MRRAGAVINFSLKHSPLKSVSCINLKRTLLFLSSLPAVLKPNAAAFPVVAPGVEPWGALWDWSREQFAPVRVAVEETLVGRCGYRSWLAAAAVLPSPEKGDEGWKITGLSSCVCGLKGSVSHEVPCAALWCVRRGGFLDYFFLSPLGKIFN